MVGPDVAPPLAADEHQLRRCEEVVHGDAEQRVVHRPGAGESHSGRAVPKAGPAEERAEVGRPGCRVQVAHQDLRTSPPRQEANERTRRRSISGAARAGGSSAILAMELTPGRNRPGAISGYGVSLRTAIRCRSAGSIATGVTSWIEKGPVPWSWMMVSPLAPP